VGPLVGGGGQGASLSQGGKNTELALGKEVPGTGRGRNGDTKGKELFFGCRKGKRRGFDRGGIQETLSPVQRKVAELSEERGP